VLADNPKLDTRDWHGQHPTRVLIDREGRLPKESFVLDQSVPTLIFTANKHNENKENCTFEILDFNQNIVPQLLQRLYEHRLQSVIIEGGTTTIQHFIDLNMWDEARIFIGVISFHSGIKAPILQKKNPNKLRIATDELLILSNHD
ncbi:MAG: riboflavin biosynthesis protein RibD, partial [Flavobacterium sp.]